MAPVLQKGDDVNLSSTMLAHPRDRQTSESFIMEDQIKARAYQLWEADGCPAGQDQTYWFKAVAELASAAAATIKPARKRAPRVKKAA
jgi:hypothetical protein